MNSLNDCQLTHLPFWPFQMQTMCSAVYWVMQHCANFLFCFFLFLWTKIFFLLAIFLILVFQMIYHKLHWGSSLIACDRQGMFLKSINSIEKNRGSFMDWVTLWKKQQQKQTLQLYVNDSIIPLKSRVQYKALSWH